MLTELHATKKARFDRHLEQWMQLVLDLDHCFDSVSERPVAAHGSAGREIAAVPVP
jgi:hypothetical protein